jgi:hypothetical protein
MRKILNIDIDKLFMSKKERQMQKLKKFIEKVTMNTEYRFVEFEITEGTYIPNTEVSRMLGETVPVTKPISGKAYLFCGSSNDDLNTKYVCMTLEELQELISLYKEALNMKV